MKSTNNDNNASKAVALDHLGVIAGCLRANMMKCGRLPADGKASLDSPVKALDEVDHNVLKSVREILTTFRFSLPAMYDNWTNSFKFIKRFRRIFRSALLRIRLSR